MPSANCIQGDFAEALFIAEVLRRGGEVTKPFGGHCPYDLVVRFNRGWKTIQVRSSRGSKDCRPTRRGIQKTIHIRNIDPRQVDFLVAFYIPDSAWWIIPSRDLPNAKRVALSTQKRTRTARFFSAWSLLT